MKKSSVAAAAIGLVIGASAALIVPLNSGNDVDEICTKEIIVRVDSGGEHKNLRMSVVDRDGERSLYHIDTITGFGRVVKVWDFVSGAYRDSTVYQYTSTYSTEDPGYPAKYRRAKTTEEKLDVLREWIGGQ